MVKGWSHNEDGTPRYNRYRRLVILAERQILMSTVRDSGGDLAEAARKLGMGEQQLRSTCRTKDRQMRLLVPSEIPIIEYAKQCRAGHKEKRP